MKSPIAGIFWTIIAYLAIAVFAIMAYGIYVNVTYSPPTLLQKEMEVCKKAKMIHCHIENDNGTLNVYGER